MEAPKSSGASGGWFALGWSSYGAMAKTDAVIGNVNGGPVKAYYLPYQGEADATSSFSIGSTSVSSTNTGTKFL